MENKIFAVYLIAVNIISLAACVSDKRRAVKHRRRIRESTLLWLSALGGSPFMYITMRVIRHKTLHKKFMLGIPLIMLAQAVLIAVYISKRTVL